MKGGLFSIACMFVAATGAVGGDALGEEEQVMVRFSFEGKEITVSMVDNSAARNLIAILPLTLQFEDYAGSEKISSLPAGLDTTDVPEGYAPSIGDLTLYAPWGNLAFFYGDQDYAEGLVPLGSVVSGAEFLEELDTALEVTVEVVE